MSTNTLERKSYTPAKEQTLIPGLYISRARSHEFCGPSRRVLALFLATQILSQQGGSVFWITSDWQGETLSSGGISRFMNPGRLTFVTPSRQNDLLWCTEEVLRSGNTPLVITDLPEPPPLTPIRRLHLAAEAGAKNGDYTPISILLTPNDGGAAGIESRWHLCPLFHPIKEQWILSRRRARLAPPKNWKVCVEKGIPSLVQGV